MCLSPIHNDTWPCATTNCSGVAREPAGLCLTCLLKTLSGGAIRDDHVNDAGKPQRVPDQPPPAQGNPHPPIADMVKQDVLMHTYSDFAASSVKDVLADIEERKQVGIARYGTPLRGFDGRDNWIDLYQEILDALNYFRKAIYETTAPVTPEGAQPDLEQMISDYKRVIEIAVEIRRYMNRRMLDATPKKG